MTLPVQQPQPYAGQPGYPSATAAVSYGNWLDEMTNIVNNWMPVVHVFPYKMACMSYLLFDVEEYFIDESQSKTELQLRVKNFWDGKFSLTVMTNEDCGLERWEEIHTFDYTTVAADVTASATVTLVDASRLKGIQPSTRIRFETNAGTNPVTRVWLVTVVAGNTITLSETITLKAWDKVFRGANLRKRCGTIDNSYQLNKRAKYISYFQTLQADLEFETCEISQDRNVYYINSKTPQFLVNQKANAMFENLLKVDFLDMFLYAENQAQGSWATAAAQTMGLLSTIQDAQISNGKAYILDLASAVGTTDDEKVIATLIAIRVRAFQSGYYNNEPITAIINSKQLENLMFMAPAFEEFFGIQMYKENPSTHQGCRDYVSLRVHGIEIEHGIIEFVLFSPLDFYYDLTPIMILMPRSSVWMYQRKFTKVDSNLRVSQAWPEMFPKFTVKDISEYTSFSSGGDECFKFITKLEAGLAYAGIYNDAFYVLKNAKSYRMAQAGNYVQEDMVVRLLD